MHPSEGNDAPGVEMPRYQCHKQVWALKIESVSRSAAGDATITPAEAGYAPFKVALEYMEKHKPHAGGYYVVYDDGYKSFSPAKAFEEGYRLLPRGGGRPTVEELAAILNSEDDTPVTINPDGSITAASGGLVGGKIAGDPRAFRPR